MSETSNEILQNNFHSVAKSNIQLEQESSWSNGVHNESDSECSETDSDVESAKSENSDFEDSMKETASNAKHRNRSHKCHCGKTFSKPSRLTQHMRIHTGERPFKCEVADCTKTYARLEHLRRHLRNHALKSNSSISKPPRKQFKCPVAECASGIFTRKWDFRLHLFGHGLTDGYKCDQCSAEYATRQRLNRHITNRHAKVYKCDVDGMQFETWSALQKHKSIHRKPRPAKQNVAAAGNSDQVELFKCGIATCSRVYYHKRNLTAHLRKHHLDSSACLAQPAPYLTVGSHSHAC